MQLYRNIKQARLRTGKTQLEVAKDIGISNGALSNYETGYREPDLDTLCQLAKYYGVSVDELLGMDGLVHEPVYDLWALAKNRQIAFKGEVYQLRDSQKQVLNRELQLIFDRFEKCKIKK